MEAKMKIINGVDVGKVEGAIEAMKGDAGLAKFKFRISNEWVDGGRNHTKVGSFYGLKQDINHKMAFEMDADAPEVLAGQDSAPEALEYLLNALASCVTSTLVYHAALRGIKIEALESHLEGDIDLRGFLGVSNEVRRGFENIRVNFKVKTDAENIDKLKALSKMSPVLDVVSNGTRVDVVIERMAGLKAA